MKAGSSGNEWKWMDMRNVWEIELMGFRSRDRQGNFKMPFRFGQLVGGWGTC